MICLTTIGNCAVPFISRTSRDWHQGETLQRKNIFRRSMSWWYGHPISKWSLLWTTVKMQASRVYLSWLPQTIYIEIGNAVLEKDQLKESVVGCTEK